MKKHKKWYFCLGVFLFLAISCKSTFNGVISKRHTTYGLLPLPNWQAKRFRGADAYLTNDEENTSIILTASCQRVSQSPLVALTAQILAGFTEIQYLEQHTIMVAEREGLVSEVLAKLDGVERYLKILVMRKNVCVYDMVLMSDKKRQNCDKDFDEMVKTFWAKAEL